MTEEVTKVWIKRSFLLLLTALTKTWIGKKELSLLIAELTKFE